MDRARCQEGVLQEVLVYETWCQTCYEKEREAIEHEVDDEEEKKRQIEMI